MPLFLSLAATISGCSNEVNHKDESAIRAETIDVCAAELQRADQETLVIFDCDDVLLTGTDQILKKRNWKDFCGLYEKYFRDEAEYHKGFAGFLKTRASAHVSDQMPKIVESLQGRGVKTVVLTGLATAPFAGMKDVRKWRGKVLHKLGYHFEKSWGGLPEKYLGGFYYTYDPYYREGVIYTGDASKDKALAAFLKYANLRPKRIIFIDDSLANVQNIGKFCGAQGIEYTGIEYVEGENVASGVEYSLEIAELQFKTLRDSGVWLSDKEAAGRVAS